MPLLKMQARHWTSLVAFSAGTFFMQAVSAAGTPLSTAEKSLNTEKLYSCSVDKFHLRAPEAFQKAVSRSPESLLQEVRKMMSDATPEMAEYYGEGEWFIEAQKIGVKVMNDCTAEVSGQAGLRLTDEKTGNYFDFSLWDKKSDTLWKDMKHGLDNVDYDHERKKWLQVHQPR